MFGIGLTHLIDHRLQSELPPEKNSIYCSRLCCTCWKYIKEAVARENFGKKVEFQANSSSHEPHFLIA